MTAQNKNIVIQDIQPNNRCEADIFNQGAGWEAEKEANYTRSESRAWKVAGGLFIILILLAIAIVSLIPLKAVVPYVFTVDKTTGRIELVSAVDDRQILGYQELTDKYWANEYVISRESYNYKLLQRDYDKVLLLSSDEVGRDYAASFDGDNSLDSKYGNTVELRIHVFSITIAEDNVGKKAVVRFSKSLKRTDSTTIDPSNISYFVATFPYDYKPSMAGNEKDLIANPMGYKVVGYRVDPEMAPVVNDQKR